MTALWLFLSCGGQGPASAPAEPAWPWLAGALHVHSRTGSNAQDGHKEAWGRAAKPHYPDAEPGSMNGAPPVADEADEYAHVQGMLR